MRTIKELRQEQGLTQLALAYKLGITPLTVSKWERGISDPRVAQLRKLSEVFGVSMDDIALVTRDDAEGKAAA